MSEKNFIIDAIREKGEKESVKPDASSEQESSVEEIKKELEHELAKWEHNRLKGGEYEKFADVKIKEIRSQLAEFGGEIPEKEPEEKVELEKDQTILDSENFTAEYAQEKLGKEEKKDINPEEKAPGKNEAVAADTAEKPQDAGFAKVDRNNIEDAEFVEVGPQKKHENIPTREAKISQLRKEVEEARKEFLETEYKKSTALKRIRKFFGNSQRSMGTRADLNGKDYDIENKEQNVEKTDYDIQWYRAQYDNKLFDLQKLMIEDAEEKGASNEELAEIATYFKVEQRINMAAAHDEVKIEQEEGNLKRYLGENIGGKMQGIGNKMVEISKSYQALPAKKKFAIGVTIMASSVGVAAIGAALGGSFGGILAVSALTTRLAMGNLAGTGLSLSLEAEGQVNDMKNIEKQKEKFLQEIAHISEEAKYDLLRDNIKNIAIKDEENELNKIKNQDIKQLAAGTAYGTFIAGVLPELTKVYGGQIAHWLAEKFGLTGHHVNVAGHHHSTGHGHHPAHHAHHAVHHDKPLPVKEASNTPPPSPPAETVTPPPPPPIHEYIPQPPPQPPADLPYGNVPEVHINVHINPDHFAGMEHRQALHEIRVGMFHSPEQFSHLKDVPVLNEHGNLNIHELHQAGLSGDSHKMIHDFATSHQHPEIRPRGGETFEGWTRRATGVMTRMNPGAVGRHR